MKLKLLLLFVGAFLIRLMALNQSLWLDEATTAQVVKYLNFSEILGRFSPFDFHPPLYYFFIKLWTGIFGFSEISLRLPSVIASLMCAYVVYLIGKTIKNENAGFWAATFFLFNPLIIYYSQEARMYTFVTLTLTILVYLLINQLRVNESMSLKRVTENNGSYRSVNLISMGLMVVSSSFLFYGSVLFIIGLLFYLIFQKRFVLAGYLSLMLVVSYLLLFPLLVQQLSHAQLSLQLVKSWSLVLGKTSLKNLLLIPLKFASGRISFYLKVIYYFLSGLWMVIVGLPVVAGMRKNRMLSWLLITPLALGLIVSLVTPMLQYFRFLYLLPILSILMAVGIDQLESDRVNGLKSYRIIVWFGLVGWSLAYLLLPQFHREDWKSLTHDLAIKAKVYAILPSADPINYYRPDVHLVDLRSLTVRSKMDRQIVIVPYTSEIHGFNYERITQLLGYSVKTRKSYRGVTIEYWEKM